ncbi:MAG: nucleotide sugar dehydrogenase [Alphaproteobacteria bacterium]|nr:nucleotide sugar dehydrogenase [Alphaproteobacteria bacterium]
MLKLYNTDVSLSDENIKIEINRLANSLPQNRPKLSVFGLGYVGAVTSVCFANMGYKVIGVDLDEVKVDQMNSGIAPIKEARLDENLAVALEAKKFRATTDAKDAVENSDISLVSVCTPSHVNGSCNISYLIDVSKSIGKVLKNKDSYHLIIYRSTIPPGTTQEILTPIIEEASGKKHGVDFGVCFNPEFLRESTAIKDFYKSPKTVIGSNDKKAAQLASSLYENVEGEIFLCKTEVAEFIKYTDNTWHALKVSFANEIGRLCKAANVDSHAVMDIFCSDTKLNISKKYLSPGTAFGGSCLPKDVRAIQNLASYFELDLPVINSIIKSNEVHVDYIINRISMNAGQNVGFLGVTFKPGTDDLRESPIIAVIEQLTERGKHVRLHDNNITKNSEACEGGNKIIADLAAMSTRTAFELCKSSDIIVVTHHTKEYQELIETFSQEKIIIDLVRLNTKTRDAELYQGICW